MRQEMITKTVLLREVKMANKVLAWITLVSFLTFLWSCYSWQKVSVRSIQPNEREGKLVSAVQTTSGERIELRKNPAASIQGDSVMGQRLLIYEGKTMTQAWAPFSKPLSDIDFVWVRKLNVAATVALAVGIPAALTILGVLIAESTQPFGEWGWGFD